MRLLTPQLRSLLKLAWPTVLTYWIQFSIQFASTLFIGHLGADYLGAAAVANMTVNLTGFSLGLGMATAVDTLCSQAFGARRYSAVGLAAQRGMTILSLLCIPLAAVWWNTHYILVLIGIPATTSALAGVYARWLIIGMWPNFMFEVVRRYLQAQHVIWPGVVAAAVASLLNVVTNYLAVIHFDLGFDGAAISTAMSNWFLFITCTILTCLRGAYLRRRGYSSNSSFLRAFYNKLVWQQGAEYEQLISDSKKSAAEAESAKDTDPLLGKDDDSKTSSDRDSGRFSGGSIGGGGGGGGGGDDDDDDDDRYFDRTAAKKTGKSGSRRHGSDSNQQDNKKKKKKKKHGSSSNERSSGRCINKRQPTIQDGGADSDADINNDGDSTHVGSPGDGSDELGFPTPTLDVPPQPPAGDATAPGDFGELYDAEALLRKESARVVEAAAAAAAAAANANGGKASTAGVNINIDSDGDPEHGHGREGQAAVTSGGSDPNNQDRAFDDSNYNSYAASRQNSSGRSSVVILDHHHPAPMNLRDTGIHQRHVRHSFHASPLLEAEEEEQILEQFRKTNPEFDNNNNSNSNNKNNNNRNSTNNSNGSGNNTNNNNNNNNYNINNNNINTNNINNNEFSTSTYGGYEVLDAGDQAHPNDRANPAAAAANGSNYGDSDQVGNRTAGRIDTIDPADTVDAIAAAVLPTTTANITPSIVTITNPDVATKLIQGRPTTRRRQGSVVQHMEPATIEYNFDYASLDTWPKPSRAIFQEWGTFLKLGVPGALSVLLEWGSFEVTSIIASRLGTVYLDVHTIFVQTSSVWYMPALGLAAATTTLVGNALGAGQPKLAMLYAKIAAVTELAYGVLNGGIFVLGIRRNWARVFTSDEQVLDIFSTCFYIMWIYTCVDVLKCVTSSILRGCGRPAITVWGNLLACAGIGFPAALLFVFKLHYGLVGLWGAMALAWFVAMVVYTVVIWRTDWKKEAEKARSLAEAATRCSKQAIAVGNISINAIGTDDERTSLLLSGDKKKGNTTNNNNSISSPYGAIPLPSEPVDI